MTKNINCFFGDLHINRNPFMLACPFLPTMMWSCTEMPSGLAMSRGMPVSWHVSLR